MHFPAHHTLFNSGTSKVIWQQCQPQLRKKCHTADQVDDGVSVAATLLYNGEVVVPCCDILTVSQVPADCCITFSSTLQLPFYICNVLFW